MGLPWEQVPQGAERAAFIVVDATGFQLLPGPSARGRLSPRRPVRVVTVSGRGMAVVAHTPAAEKSSKVRARRLSEAVGAAPHPGRRLTPPHVRDTGGPLRDPWSSPADRLGPRRQPSSPGIEVARSRLPRSRSETGRSPGSGSINRLVDARRRPRSGYSPASAATLAGSRVDSIGVASRSRSPPPSALSATRCGREVRRPSAWNSSLISTRPPRVFERAYAAARRTGPPPRRALLQSGPLPPDSAVEAHLGWSGRSLELIRRGRGGRRGCLRNGGPPATPSRRGTTESLLVFT